MAIIIVTESDGRPAANDRVEAITVTKYAWSNYNRVRITDKTGVCELPDRNERYQLLVNGILIKTVDSLRGVIHLKKTG